MVLNYIVTDREEEHSFTVTDSNKHVYCKGKTQGNAFTIVSKVIFKDETLSIYGDYQKNIQEQPLVEKSEVGSFYTENEYMNANRAYFLNSEEDTIGQIKRKRIDCKVLWAEKYEMEYCGENYSAYYIAKPFKGLYYVIVDKNDNTVSVIRQNVHSINYYFNYRVFSENDYFAKLAILFLVYADNHKYGGKWVYSGIQIRGETTLVAQPKEVKNHFDKEFIKKTKIKKEI